jgi:hypothetical protein
MSVKLWRKCVIIGCVSFALSACSSSDNDVVAPTQSPLRVIHASPDAPRVNVLLDGDALLSEVNFAEGSAFVDQAVGNYDLQVDALTPGGELAVIEVNDFAIEADTEYSVIALGKVADQNLAPLVISNPDVAVPAGQVRAQVVHAAPDAPAVAVYVTAPDADLAGETPLGTFEFGEELGPVEVPAGDYQIRVTLADDPATVVFDAGTLPLTDGADLLLVAVSNTRTGDAPITVLLNDGTTQSELLDVDTPADVRAGHFSPDAPGVDVVVDDNFAAPLFVNATYPGFTDYASAPAATYNLKVLDNATQSLTVIEEDIELEQGKSYSVLAVNLLTDIEPLILTDDRRSVATEARVRIVHGSPAAGNVDIYVVAPGTDINTVDPNFENVPFKAETGYVALAGGTYEVSVTPTGDKNAAIFAELEVANGDVFTVVARDATGGGAPLALTVKDETE